MRLIICLYLIIFVICIIRLVSSQSFLYEKMHGVGVGRRNNIDSYRRSGADSGLQFFNKEEHPAPLPPPSPAPYYRSPYNNIYQGARRKGDKRVYNSRFDHVPATTAHQVSCEGMFDCIITYMAVETVGGIPMIIRGGAGYRYFFVVAKAKAGDQLTGRVRAFCKVEEEEPAKH